MPKKLREKRATKNLDVLRKEDGGRRAGRQKHSKHGRTNAMKIESLAIVIHDGVFVDETRVADGDARHASTSTKRAIIFGKSQICMLSFGRPQKFLSTIKYGKRPTSLVGCARKHRYTDWVNYSVIKNFLLRVLCFFLLLLSDVF